MMDRRAFVKTFGVALAAFGLDPDRLLWVPGAKTIFIPEQTGEIVAYDESWLADLSMINLVTYRYLRSEGIHMAHPIKYVRHEV